MANKTDIWMPLYINDFLADTMHLSAEEAGAYLLIIMNYWKKGSIGGNIERISRISRISSSITQALLEEFFIYAEGEWKHSRIEKELEIARENKRKKEERARAAAEARWGKKDATSNAQACPKGKPQALPEDMLEECPSSSPSPSPITSEKKTPLPPAGGTERRSLDSVIDFWNGKGNLPRAPMACNLPNPGKLADIINDYGPEYVKDAIEKLSENFDTIERQFRPGSIKTFLENSVSRWYDFQEKESTLSEADESFIKEVVF